MRWSARCFAAATWLEQQHCSKTAMTLFRIWLHPNRKRRYAVCMESAIAYLRVST
jgi:hypothetical protein